MRGLLRSGPSECGVFIGPSGRPSRARQSDGHGGRSGRLVRERRRALKNESSIRARWRKFRFLMPQRVAAGLLLLFLAQGLWLTSRQTLSERDYAYARCGREMWEHSPPLAGYFTSCGNIHDGVLAYRLAGLPLSLYVDWERVADHFRKPEDRVMATSDAPVSAWELRHQMTHVMLLLRLPFMAAGLVLGGVLWWVTRRLFGDAGGYVALALYCFSPPVLRLTVMPNPEILTALGLFAAIYTAIGVAHAMQGPRRKWRPRIALLTLTLGVVAASHIAALPVALGLSLVLMLWIAEGRRSMVLPVLLASGAGAMVLLFACYNVSPDAFSYVFRSDAGQLGISLEPARRFYASMGNAGLTIAVVAAFWLYGALKRTIYFGNTTPLLVAVVFSVAVTRGVPGAPQVWALPFVCAFVAGVFADTFEMPKGRIAVAAAVAVCGLQAVFCLLSLPGLL